jgi:hypothetical protein
MSVFYFFYFFWHWRQVVLSAPLASNAIRRFCLDIVRVECSSLK